MLIAATHYLAGAEGLEPPGAALEAARLPLTNAP